MKKELTEEATDTNAKITLDLSDTLTVTEKVDGHIANSQSSRKSADERKIELATKLLEEPPMLGSERMQ